MGDVYVRRKIGLCLTAVNISNGVPRVFKTPHDPNKHADNKRTLVDICLATSAAPIIFPIASIPEPDNDDLNEGFVDGGLWANNPTLVGLLEALNLSQREQSIEIVSIGTNPPSGGQAFNEKETNKGVKYWEAGIKPLEMAMTAQSYGFDFMCSFLAKNLNRLGKKVTICRLSGKSLPQEQENKVGLDIATDEACKILRNAGITDGQQIHGKILTEEKNEKFKILSDIFKNLNDLNNQEGTWQKCKNSLKNFTEKLKSNQEN